ncbi:hypothetical protein BD311DRAFT_764951 [Dichomitus squalens]|uniref:Uncharacterized protein n=1 Tax=Dichomitus squalens TaxID=114155 RepID=A0A4Q9MGM3_9APHY|nr:hypothetical protein BD311DRAFT_764951 [Dichomitus squalens]
MEESKHNARVSSRLSRQQRSPARPRNGRAAIPRSCLRFGLPGRSKARRCARPRCPRRRPLGRGRVAPLGARRYGPGGVLRWIVAPSRPARAPVPTRRSSLRCASPRPPTAPDGLAAAGRSRLRPRAAPGSWSERASPASLALGAAPLVLRPALVGEGATALDESLPLQTRSRPSSARTSRLRARAGDEARLPPAVRLRLSDGRSPRFPSRAGLRR